MLHLPCCVFRVASPSEQRAVNTHSFLTLTLTLYSPPSAQFGLCELSEDDTHTFIEVGSKVRLSSHPRLLVSSSPLTSHLSPPHLQGVMDMMKTIFVASGRTVPISPLGREGCLPPIIHVPAALEPQTPKLILCYFLVATNATDLDEILIQQPMPGVEFHCFTSKALESTKSSLQSHAKQRKLFQELFARCTGVIVSAGNETVRTLRSRSALLFAPLRSRALPL